MGSVRHCWDSSRIQNTHDIVQCTCGIAEGVAIPKY